MRDHTKIQFLPSEMELVSSPAIILTKNAIIQKVRSFLEEIELKQKKIVTEYKHLLPSEIFNISPKISRGENYKGLPWLVLDNPRFFQSQNIFAIRTLFWWGNFFSITLHLSGRYKLQLNNVIKENLLLLQSNEFFINISNNEWEHDINEENSVSISSLTPEELQQIISEKDFLKISIKFPIGNFSEIENNLLKNYEGLLKICC